MMVFRGRLIPSNSFPFPWFLCDVQLFVLEVSFFPLFSDSFIFLVVDSHIMRFIVHPPKMVKLSINRLSIKEIGSTFVC